MGPVTVSTFKTTRSGDNSNTGDTAQYATSTQGLTHLSKAGANKCSETSTDVKKNFNKRGSSGCCHRWRPSIDHLNHIVMMTKYL